MFYEKQLYINLFNGDVYAAGDLEATIINASTPASVPEVVARVLWEGSRDAADHQSYWIWLAEQVVEMQNV